MLLSSNFKRVASLGTLSFTLFASSSYAESNRFFVNTEILKIRSQPNINSFVLGYYDLSRTDSITNIANGWIETPKGFVKKEFVTLYEKIKDLNTQGIVTANSLTVRANPGIKSVIMYGYKKDESIHAVALYKNDKDELWIQTKEGFVSAEYVDLKVLSQNKPIEPTVETKKQVLTEKHIEDNTEKEEPLVAPLEEKPVQEKIEKEESPEKVIVEKKLEKEQIIQEKPVIEEKKKEIVENKETTKELLRTQEEKTELKEKEQITKEIPVIEKEKDVLSSTLTMKLAGVSASSKADDKTSIELDKSGLSLSLDMSLKEYKYEDLYPSGSIGYTSFSDKEIVLASLGVSKEIMKSEWSIYSTASIGYGILNWKEDLLKNSDKKDMTSTSSILSLEVGGVYKNGFGLFANYSFTDFKTKIQKDGINSEITDKSFFSVGGSYRF